MKAGKVLKVAGNILLWILVLLAVVVTVISISATKSKSGVPEVFGKMFASISSDSMEPTIMTGDLIMSDVLVGAEDKAELKKDDIITFFTDLNGDGIEELNTHRIIDVKEDGGYIYFTTKGDNNDNKDQSDVIAGKVVGKYTGTSVPKLGYVLNFLRQPTGFLLCVVAPLALFFLYELFRFISLLLSSRAKKLSKEEEEDIKKKAVEEYMAELEKKKEAEQADQVHQTEKIQSADQVHQTESIHQTEKTHQAEKIQPADNVDSANDVPSSEKTEQKDSMSPGGDVASDVKTEDGESSADENGSENV